MKAGIETSEFWVTVIFAVGSTVAMLDGRVSPEFWTTTMAALAGVYNVSRAIVKAGNGKRA